ncbi:hypothetical protein GCM10009647_056910 [Streptomyces sanglieri]
MERVTHSVLRWALRASAWVRHGRKYDCPVRPDRLLWLDPDVITHKPVRPPESATVPPTLIVGGDWDRKLRPLDEDIVFEAFHRRFVEEQPWEETGYIEFMSTERSEHGGLSRSEAKARCAQIDKLYRFINEEGYRTQAQLEQEGSLIDDLTNSVRPPVYREVAVDITRDGEFVWHGGIHRLVIAKFANIDQIPVRVNIRHERWQARRETAYEDNDAQQFSEHPDIRYLIE